MSTVLITGASGFVGRHCLPLLVEKGYDVHAVSRQRPAAATLPGVCWHECDLLLPGAATEIIRQVRPNYILHLAWYAAPDNFWTANENVEWVRASLELFSAFAANNGQRVVVAGSCAEYERNAGECTEGRTRLQPITLYGVCKYALSEILHSFSEQAGFGYAWGRIFFLYGPHEHPSRLVAYVVQSLLRDEPALCSDGNQILDFSHVEDAACAFVSLLESKVQGPVNIASGRPLAVRDMLLEIGRQLGRLELIRFGARNSGSEISRLWANTLRLRNEVGWAPRYDLKSGVEQTIQWWRSVTGIHSSERMHHG